MKHIDFKEIVASKAPETAKKIPNFVYYILEKWLCVEQINVVMERHKDLQGVDFVRDVLSESFQVKINVHGKENIPHDSKLIVASNHPLGGFDGMALIQAVADCREDIIFPVNDFLTYIPNLAPLFIPINKVGSNAHNARLLEDSFSSDKTILYFPAGLCSRKIKGEIVDLQWKKTFIKQAIRHERLIVPTYIDGRNSNAFYNIANLRKFLKIKFNFEMSMLPRELFKQKNKVINITFGKPIHWTTFDQSKTELEWAESMRQFVYTLNDSPDKEFRQ